MSNDDHNDDYHFPNEDLETTSKHYFIENTTTTTTDSNVGRFFFDDDGGLAELTAPQSNCTFFNGTERLFVFSEADSMIAWFVLVFI